VGELRLGRAGRRRDAASDATIHASCGDCDEALTLTVQHGKLERADGVVHFAVPAARWWDDIVFT